MKPAAAGWEGLRIARADILPVRAGGLRSISMGFQSRAALPAPALDKHEGV